MLSFIRRIVREAEHVAEEVEEHVGHAMDRVARALGRDAETAIRDVEEAAEDVEHIVEETLRGTLDLRWFPRSILRTLGAGDAPGIPLVGLVSVAEALLKLAKRSADAEPARLGLTDRYTIGDETASAYEFVYGRVLPAGGALSDHRTHVASRLLVATENGGASDLVRAARELEHLTEAVLRSPDDAVSASGAPSDIAHLSLTHARQWEMGWTRYAGIHERATADALGGTFAASLDPSDPDAASAAFWPTLSAYGTPYNLLILAKVADLDAVKGLFEERWDDQWDADDLYQIDLRLFERLPYDDTNRRFTPSTVTVLRRSPNGSLTPLIVRVAGRDGRDATEYIESDGAWLYALGAARASATLFGIWLGHVYHWHIVSAAALQSLEPAIQDPAHPVRQLLDLQSEALREFDEALLLTWTRAAPPTSVSTAAGFFRLLSDYAGARTFYDDDPLTTLSRHGITAQAFSDQPGDWAHYPIVKGYLEVWEASENYVRTVVDAHYATNDAISADAPLQAWVQSMGDADAGNLRGLGEIDTRDALVALLTSLIYRLTVHGVGRLMQTANPALTYVANFPPCLHSDEIPKPSTALTAEDLFGYLPHTGTIGLMLNFYWEFSFSQPYVPFIPFGGVEAPGPFTGSGATASNVALVRFRTRIQAFIDAQGSPPAPGLPQRYQWPIGIET